MIGYITIKKFSEDTGYSENAIYKKIHNGVWAQNRVWIKAGDGRILISTEGFNKWVENSLVSRQSAKHQLKSPSPIKEFGAANESSLSPPPLI